MSHNLPEEMFDDAPPPAAPDQNMQRPVIAAGVFFFLAIGAVILIIANQQGNVNDAQEGQQVAESVASVAASQASQGLALATQVATACDRQQAGAPTASEVCDSAADLALQELAVPLSTGGPQPTAVTTETVIRGALPPVTIEVTRTAAGVESTVLATVTAAADPANPSTVLVTLPAGEPGLVTVTLPAPPPAVETVVETTTVLEQLPAVTEISMVTETETQAVTETETATVTETVAAEPPVEPGG